MVQNKYLHYSVAFFLLIGSYSWSQFIEVNAELDLRRLSENDRQLFTTLAEDIENYLLNTQFSADANDLEVVIDIRLVLESVSRGGSQTSINAQAIFSNKLDQYFYAKGFQSNQYLRSMRFNYFTALDALGAEEVDITIVKNAMSTFHEDLLTLDKKLGSNKETLHFLKAYHESIAELLSVLNLKDALELLLLYDHDNKKVYESYLKN